MTGLGDNTGICFSTTVPDDSSMSIGEHAGAGPSACLLERFAHLVKSQSGFLDKAIEALPVTPH